MTNFELYDYYDMHKSIGIILSSIIVVRVVWRIKQGWPVPVSNNGKNELFLAKILHWVLVISTVLMPITGMISLGLPGMALVYLV
jgi:cytochrome b561